MVVFPVVAQVTSTGSDTPLETINTQTGVVDDQSTVQFSIESDDPDTYSGMISFIATNEQPIEVPLAVFVTTADKSLVKTIVLKGSPDATRWQADFDTTDLPNGRYQFQVGYRLFRGAEPVIWNQGYWALVANSATSIKPIIVTPKPEVTPQPAPETAPIPTVTEPETAPTSTVPVVAPVDTQVTDFCSRNGITNVQSCLAVEKFRLDPLCRQHGEDTIADCATYLQQTYEHSLCQSASASDAKQCNQYIIDQATKNKFCGDWPQLPCATIIGSWYRGVVASFLSLRTSIELITRPLVNQTVDWNSLISRSGLDVLTSASVVDFSGRNPMVRLIPVRASGVIDANQDWQAIWPIGLQFDGDNDGLSDDAEVRYGTKLDVVDSDGDGYLDGEELQHQYNPAGTGKAAVVAGIDQALVSGQVIEQPWTSGIASDKVAITGVSAFVNGEGLRLAGTGPGLQPITLFIGQPFPIVVTVMTDERGQWDYYLNQPIRDGAYTIYATTITSQGTISTKSKPSTFYWRQGQLVSLMQLANEQPVVKGVAYDRFGVTTPLALGLIIAGIIVGSTLVVISWRRW